jgi:hypothetical protein
MEEEKWSGLSFAFAGIQECSLWARTNIQNLQSRLGLTCREGLGSRCDGAERRRRRRSYSVSRFLVSTDDGIHNEKMVMSIVDDGCHCRRARPDRERHAPTELRRLRHPPTTGTTLTANFY